MPTSAYPLLPPHGADGAAGLSPLHALSLKNSKNQPDRNTLAQTCVEVEAVFLSQLLQQMRQTMVRPVNPKSPMLTQYLNISDQHVARHLAAGGGFGLARRLYEDLAVRQSNKPKEKQYGTAGSSSPAPGPPATADGPPPGAPGLSGTGETGLDPGPGRSYSGVGQD